MDSGAETRRLEVCKVADGLAEARAGGATLGNRNSDMKDLIKFNFMTVC